MLTFEEFKSITGGYASVDLLPQDKKDLTDYFNDNGVENIIDDLHVTVIYDTTNPAIEVQPLQDSFTTKVVGCKTLGEKDSKWFSITLILETDDLVKQHEALKELGFKHSYPEFIPHVSIKYQPTEDDIVKIKALTNDIIGKELEFGSLKIERIKD
jgi:hypothetical protein